MAPYAPANENRNRYNQGVLKSKPLVLDASQRASVESAIRETLSTVDGSCMRLM